MNNLRPLLIKTKILPQLFSTLIMILVLNACAKHPPSPPVYADWHVTKKTLMEKGQDDSYTIKAEYPVISSYPQTASAKALSQMIHDFVTAKIQEFRDNVPSDSPELEDYPDGMHVNEFHVSYVAQQLKTQRATILSIRLETELHLYGTLTRMHHFMVYNYDMTHNQLLTLDSLFKPDSDYLTVLSKKCQKQLSHRLAADMYWYPWDPSFTGAYPQNFQVWNLERNGLAITFQEYQVTPYSYKPIVILLPFSGLRGVLADDAPVREYAY